MAKPKSGGGIRGNKVVQKGVRSGAPKTRVVNVIAASQLGNKQGSHVTEKGDLPFRREPLYGASKSQVPSGNQVAAQTKAGPGGSRTVMRSGTQAQHGPAAGAPKPAGRDVWKDFPNPGSK
jgi:hypothetical protein